MKTDAARSRTRHCQGSRFFTTVEFANCYEFRDGFIGR